MQKFLLHLKRVAVYTLPCETWMRKIATELAQIIQSWLTELEVDYISRAP